MIHTTRDGKEMPIATMGDDHLMNFIRMLFKSFKETDKPDLSEFLTGRSKPVLTPERFYSILQNYSLYIIDGLRRENTRQSILDLLSQFNPIFKEKTYIHYALPTLSKSTFEQDYDEDMGEYDGFDGYPLEH